MSEISISETVQECLGIAQDSLAALKDAYAVDAVSYQGVRVEVVSLRAMTSDSLINVADRYIDLDQIKEDIQKTTRHDDPYRSFTGFGILDECDTP